MPFGRNFISISQISALYGEVTWKGRSKRTSYFSKTQRRILFLTLYISAVVPAMYTHTHPFNGLIPLTFRLKVEERSQAYKLLCQCGRGRGSSDVVRWPNVCERRWRFEGGNATPGRPHQKRAHISSLLFSKSGTSFPATRMCYPPDIGIVYNLSSTKKALGAKGRRIWKELVVNVTAIL